MRFCIQWFHVHGLTQHLPLLCPLNATPPPLMSQAALLENAIVIQLWHYRDYHYIRGPPTIIATTLAYK